MDQAPRDPEGLKGPDGNEEFVRSGGWQRAALGALAILGILFAIALIFLPLPMGSQPQTAQAAKHPSYPQGKACDAPGCHDDFTHKQPYSDRPCETCHITESWRIVQYTHSYAELNRGIHAAIGCSRCHDYGSPPPDPACQTCHADTSPHKSPAYTKCASCHQAIGWQFLKVPKGHLSLEGGHAGLDCTACHNPVSFKAPGKDCSNCHGPKHGYTKGCARCHDPARYWNVDRNTINHDFFPFGKAHAKVKCEQCHPALQFVGISPECAACHGVNHGFNSGCTRCHSVFIGGWKIKHFDHGFYPLSGVHGSFDCSACHPTKKVRLRNPNTPQGQMGPLLPPSSQIQFVGASPNCQKCHGAPHGSCLSTSCWDCHNTRDFGDVDFNHRQVWRYYTGSHTKLACSKCHSGLEFCRVKGTTCPACHGLKHGFTTDVCLNCHNTTSWSQVHFDHEAVWPYYSGAHKSVSCAACHPGNKFVPAPSGVCSNCHGAPHGPCLDSQGVGCVVCHNTSSWTNVHFSHRRYWVNWTGAHTSLPCSSCHPGGIVFCNLNSGQNLNCSSSGCHGGQHGYATNSPNSLCQNCHNTTAFWPLNGSWSHPIPLGGFHSEGNVRPDGSSRCNLCHVSYNFENAPRGCQECHAGDVPHGSCFETVNCVACHWPTSWADVHFTHPQRIWEIHDSELDVQDCTLCHPASPAAPIGNFCELQCTPCHSGIPPGPWN